MKRLELFIPPPIVMCLCALPAWALSKLFPALNLSWISEKYLLYTMGIIACLAGGISILLFFKNGTTINPHKPEQSIKLVTTGLYRYTRNPMYLSLLLILITVIFHFGNLLSFIFIPLFIAYMNRFQIKPEEKVLKLRFKEEYEAYCKKARRWL